MTTKTKIIIGIGAVSTILTFLAYQKKKALDKILDKLTYRINAINSFDIVGGITGNIKVNLDLAIGNPTDTDFSILTFGFLKIRTITLYFKGIPLGSATQNITKFQLPANSNFLLKNIQLDFPILQGIQTFANFGLQNMKDPDNYTAKVRMSILGWTFDIGNNPQIGM